MHDHHDFECSKSELCQKLDELVAEGLTIVSIQFMGPGNWPGDQRFFVVSRKD